jgi:hypothetical protein
MTKKEAEKRLKKHGKIKVTIGGSFGADVECGDELRALGLNVDLIYKCIYEIDYHRHSPWGNSVVGGDDERFEIKWEFERVSNEIGFDLEWEFN